MTRESDKGSLPGAQAFELAGLVEYQQGAIVSRTLVKQTGGSTTLFAFDRGQALSEHTTSFDALVVVLDGEVELTIGGQQVVARAGQIVLMPANVPHALTALQPFKMLLVMVRGLPAGA